jgi:hypothetical protein
VRLEPTAFVAVLLVCFVLGSVILYFAWRRLTPNERERRRRLQVNSLGRISNGTVVDVVSGDGASGHVIHYSYSLRGVDYSASQDVSFLLDHVGTDLSRIPSSVSVKYDPRNPSNSILICEKWSGLRARPDADT